MITITDYVSLLVNVPQAAKSNPIIYFLSDESKPRSLFYLVDEDLQGNSHTIIQRSARLNSSPAAGLFVEEWNLRAYGVYDEVYDLLAAAGLRTPFTGKTPCYAPLVFEFYSTFYVIYGQSGRINGWGFQIGGQTFQVQKTDICRWLNIPTDFNQHSCYQTNVKDEFWNYISGENQGFMQSIPTTHIKNTVWRVIHAIVSQNFTSDICLGTVITKKDLIIITSIHLGEIPNWFGMLTDLFFHKGALSTFLVGGAFIIKIAMRLDFDFSLYTGPPGGVSVLSLELLEDK